MGRRCIAGDDGRLTWLVLAQGYRTVHQSSAKALSMFPSTFRAFVKQRVRWSRNSFRCYLTAIRMGWLRRQPIITQLTVLQILLTPVTMGMSLAYLIFSRLEYTVIGAALAVAWVVVGRGVRGFSHLRQHPRDLLLLPLMTLTVILVALPIKLFAFVTMHLANLSLNLISIKAADAGLEWLLEPWQSVPGTILLYGAAAVHVVLVLRTLYLKRTLKMPAREAAQILLRAAVAALLDAAHPDVKYPRTEAEIIAAVNAALASKNRKTILALAAELDSSNNAGECPLN